MVETSINPWTKSDFVMNIDVTEKYSKFIINYLFYFLFSEN